MPAAADQRSGSVAPPMLRSAAAAGGLASAGESGSGINCCYLSRRSLGEAGLAISH
jgi:hypothetical protein